MSIRPSRSSRLAAAIAGTALVLIVVSCFATETSITSGAPAASIPGLWRGFWHGFIAPIAFIVSLFSDHVRIYAVPNAGRWYDFGFMLGIGGFSGGIFAGSRTRTAATREPRDR